MGLHPSLQALSKGPHRGTCIIPLDGESLLFQGHVPKCAGLGTAVPEAFARSSGAHMSTLNTLGQIWSVVMLYTVSTGALFFAGAGLVFSVVHFRSWPKRILMWSPLLAAVAGGAISLGATAPIAFFIALVYVSIPTAMSRFPGAAAWGIALGIFAVLFNAKVFSRII